MLYNKQVPNKFNINTLIYINFNLKTQCFTVYFTMIKREKEGGKKRESLHRKKKKHNLFRLPVGNIGKFREFSMQMQMREFAG